MSEEEREAYDDMRADLNSGECAVLDDSQAMRQTNVTFCGRLIGRTNDRDEAMRLVKGAMKAAQYWPNIYHINDHGNVTLLDHKGEELCAWV